MEFPSSNTDVSMPDSCALVFLEARARPRSSSFSQALQWTTGRTGDSWWPGGGEHNEGIPSAIDKDVVPYKELLLALKHSANKQSVYYVQSLWYPTVYRFLTPTHSFFHQNPHQDSVTSTSRSPAGAHIVPPGAFFTIPTNARNRALRLAGYI